MSYHQIFLIRIRKNVTTQDQSQEKHNDVLDWFMPSQRVIVLRPVSLYYALEKLITPDELRVTTYIN
jgi:hypothetical protein